MDPENFTISVSGPNLKFEKNVKQKCAESVIALVLSESVSNLGPSKMQGLEGSVVRPRASRSIGGSYDLTILGRNYQSGSIRMCLKQTLLAIAHQRPSFLEQLSKKIVKNRRVVARNPDDLYINSPHLAKNYAEQLVNGWYFDTNLSSTQLRLRLELVCQVAGLEFGRDLIPPERI